ncbi:NtaA/DmoA family FMN-dependent monooxygenase [Micrococcaceae bacterium Sec5.1]
MNSKQMILGMEFGNASGTQPGAWRMPGVDPLEYLDYDFRVSCAQAAERGKIHFLFFPNGPFHVIDIERGAPQMTPDPTVHMAILARETERIGFVVTASTLYNHPYTLAAQLKTLDFISRGRAAWNTVASGGPDVAANYGAPMTPSEDRYARARESIELVQSLWASWGRDAWVHDQESGQYTKPGGVASVSFEGNYVNSQGPLYVPPSEQGQPVIVQSGMGENSFELAGRYADVAITVATSIEEARYNRDTIRRYAAEAGRDSDEVKVVAGLKTTIDIDKRHALDRAALLVASSLPTWVPQLGEILGVPMTMDDLDRVLQPSELGPTPRSSTGVDPRGWRLAGRAHALAREGWSVRDILAHGVFDRHPSSIGTPADAADHMQEWFESGAVDGFWICVDVYRDGIDAFVDQVVPILQERGLFHHDYEGTTLRENLGVREQYGPDFRVAQTAKP